jgi:aminopeptidase N
VIAGAPDGSPANQSEWFVGTVADLPPPPGEIARASFARQPEIIDFLAGYFGRYPWKAAGGIVDDVAELGFALENQTRPIYSDDFFTDTFQGDVVVVHELLHQWIGDHLRLERWQDIWLNEGFATYAEWLWSEREGFGSAQDTFDFFAGLIPADDPFWALVIGDPGPDFLFEIPVYWRGAMTLHALRLQIGDDAFFRLLRRWVSTQAGGTVTTAEFIALAERVSGQQLDELFDVWLYSPIKPPGIEPVAVAAAEASTASSALTTASAIDPTSIRGGPPVVRAQFGRLSGH